ncbi:MAG TPA: DUF551 domain-containing protein [Ramlibacter sp.]|nr:DUF551 domain-containing protein [Ramlibacter sp.]
MLRSTANPAGLEALHSPPAAQSGWRPIETAPKDGKHKPVLLHVNWEPLTVVGYWGAASDVGEFQSDEETWRVLWDQAPIRDGYDEPTHWMPLPEPPADG